MTEQSIWPQGVDPEAFWAAYRARKRQKRVWKRKPPGEDTGYTAVHAHLRRTGAPSRPCEHCSTTDRPRESALSHEAPKQRLKRDPAGVYSTRPEDYLILCRPCHRRYDHSFEWPAALCA
jgi:hypothetical protein